MHADPFALILLQSALLIALAVLGRWGANKLNQSSVIGELVIGLIVGNVGYQLGHPLFVLIMDLGNVSALFQKLWDQGISLAEAAPQVYRPESLGPGSRGAQVLGILQAPGATAYVVMTSGLWLFSNIGVVLLLFLVGLETRVEEMLKVGARATAIAVLGVVLPTALSYAVSWWFLPNASQPVHYFMAAAACATSIGISARVLKDLNRLKSLEARLVLGAAVIDDVLGLILLAVVAGIATSGQIDALAIGKTLLFATVFLGLVVATGDSLVKRLIPLLSRLDPSKIKLLLPLGLCFFMSWIASAIGLASIVGAFAAGLIINEEYFDKHSHNKIHIRDLIAPLESLFAPIFFLVMGLQVNLATFANRNTVIMALVFTLAAIIGKIGAGLAAGKKANRLIVGIGMIPRGEVGLIFAGIGKSLGVLDDNVFSAVVIMVMMTTLITPPLLTWAYRR